MNVLLAVFNMLPGAPLDGGRVLKALMWRRYGDRARADRLAARAGRYLGIAIAVAGAAEFVGWRNFGGLWLVLIGWFLVSAAGAEERAARVKDVMAGVRVSDIMTPDPEIAPAWSMAGDFVERVARHSHQSVFPVVGFDGALVGAVCIDQLARLHPAARSELRLDRVADGRSAALPRGARRRSGAPVTPGRRSSVSSPLSCLRTDGSLARLRQMICAVRCVWPRCAVLRATERAARPRPVIQAGGGNGDD